MKIPALLLFQLLLATSVVFGQRGGLGVNYCFSNQVKAPALYYTYKLPASQLAGAGVLFDHQINRPGVFAFYSPVKIKNLGWIYRLSLTNRYTPGTAKAHSESVGAEYTNGYWLLSFNNSIGYKVGKTLVSAEFGIGNFNSGGANNICYTTGISVSIMSRKQEKKKEISVISFKNPI